MTKYLTPNFRTYLARQFVSSITDPKKLDVDFSTTSRYVNYQYVTKGYVNEFAISQDYDITQNIDSGYFYVFAGVDTDWPTSPPPTPNTSIQGYHYDTHSEMLFGKYAGYGDVAFMISRNDWVSNTVYSKYSNYDPTLDAGRFFTVVEEGNNYHVFKCLDNNNGAPSTHKPSPYEYNAANGSIITTNTAISASNYFYKTSDNYVWMYVYSVPRLIFEKFATKDYMPLVDSSLTTVLPDGAITSYEITSTGSHHNSTLTGFIKKTNVDSLNTTLWLSVLGNDLFSYTNIYAGSSIYIFSGSGAGQLRTIVSSRVTGFEREIVVDSPFGVQLDSTSQFEISPGITVVGDGQGATAKCVVNDIGQVTSIVPITTGSNYSYANVVISSVTGYYDANTSSWVPTNTVATARAIISPPNGHLRDHINELYADKVCVSVDFISIDHPITQFAQYGLMIDPLFKSVEIVVDDVVGFSNGEIIIQPDTTTYGTITNIDQVNKVLSLSNVRGIFKANSDIIGTTSATLSQFISINTDTSKFTYSDIVKNSGEILLIKNDPIVTRVNNQTERIKLIVDF